MTGDSDAFRAVHRAQWRRALTRSLALGLAAAAVVATVWVLPVAIGGAPSSTVMAQAVVGSSVDPAVFAPAPDGAPAAPDAAIEPVADVLAAPADGTPPPPTAPVDAAGGSGPNGAGPNGVAPSTPPVAQVPTVPPVSTIGIDTSGYQAELDRCLWVRMDLAGATAPIVGAHNNCGGELVLELHPGDVVELAGEQLDGRYVVAGSRDGRPGQNAAEATAGFGATVILQTCYFDGPDVRLVALVPVS